MAWINGKVLTIEIDNTSVRHRVDPLPEEYLKLLGGGRGLAALLYMHHIQEPPQPLSPENPIVVAPGLLLGSKLTTASKTVVAARSPKTGFFGRSSVGARMGLEIRRAGYDAVVIKGSAGDPSILVIDCDGVELDPAKGLWGLKVGEARRELASRYKGYADAIIGPAGERLSAMATIDANGRQAGRTGMGAVMGAKRLKAIMVKGCRDPEPNDPVESRRIALELTRLTHKHPSSKNLIEYGTPLMMELTNKVHGVFPSLNWRRSTISWCPDPERRHEELSKFAPRMRVSRNPCTGCWRVCSQVVKARGVETDGPEYESLYSLGPIVGVCGIEEVAYLNYLADELGLDTISLGLTIAWAIEAGERGLLEGTPGWGDFEGIARLVEDIAYRRGIGDLLADGVNHAADRLGAGHEFAVHSKGLELPAYDARGLKGMAVGYAVSSRGGDHLTSGMYAVELTGRLWKFEGVNRLVYNGKGVMVKVMEDLMAYFDSMGICKFSRYTLTPENAAPLVNALTGWSLTPGDLLRMGERSVNLERLLNLSMGLTREHDWLPQRLLKEPIPDGPSRGEVVDREKLGREITAYYQARGWTPEGRPYRAYLHELDIEHLVPGWLLGYTA